MPVNYQWEFWVPIVGASNQERTVTLKKTQSISLNVYQNEEKTLVGPIK